MGRIEIWIYKGGDCDSRDNWDTLFAMEICNISLKYREIIFENYIDQNLINNSCLIDIPYLISFFSLYYIGIEIEV